MNIQDKYLALGRFGCLALCYLKCINKEESLFNDFEELVSLKILDEDCTVLDAEKLFRFYGYDVSVLKLSMKLAKGTFQAVNYKYKNYNHWILYKDGKPYWNSMANSSCVKNGQPDLTSVRDIIIKN